MSRLVGKCYEPYERNMIKLYVPPSQWFLWQHLWQVQVHLQFHHKSGAFFQDHFSKLQIHPFENRNWNFWSTCFAILCKELLIFWNLIHKTVQNLSSKMMQMLYLLPKNQKNFC